MLSHQISDKAEEDLEFEWLLCLAAAAQASRHQWIAEFTEDPQGEFRTAKSDSLFELSSR